PPGGPFSPASAGWTLTTDGVAADFTVSASHEWFSVSPATGTASATPTTVTATINDAANARGPGDYPGTVTFRYKDTGAIFATRPVALSVSVASATGVLDTDFASASTRPGTAVLPSGVITYAMAIAAGDKVVVAGTESSNTRAAVLRFNSDGT